MFKIQLYEELGYVKVSVTNKRIGSRIRKHVAKGRISDFVEFRNRLSDQLNSYFQHDNLDRKTVIAIIDDEVNKLKFGTSIFDYFDEFIEKKKNETNKKTEKPLSKSTINNYRRAIFLLKKMLRENHIPAEPQNIDETILNNYFFFRIRLSHNYRVKLHTRVKSFIKFLDSKNLPINRNYQNSCFNEKYDNQDPNEKDIALSVDQVKKLIDLRKKYKNGLVHLPDYKQTKTISHKLQTIQREKKLKNLEKTLDCFLFMIGTGQYVKDVLESKLTIISNGKTPHIKYRRTKNNALCKAIPFEDFDVFVVNTIIKEYKIRSGSNFPLNLSINSFNKHLKTISRQAGFDFELKSKMARKTFATLNYFDYEVDIRDVQKMLGHANEDQTRHYLRVEDDDLVKRIMDRRKKTVHNFWEMQTL